MSETSVHRSDAALKLLNQLGEGQGVSVIDAWRGDVFLRERLERRPDKPDAQEREHFDREVFERAMLGFQQSQFGLKLKRHSNLSLVVGIPKVEAPAVTAKLGRGGGLCLAVNAFPRAS
ncbi:hypothetical protein D3C85_1358140 [compost metagenome]